MKNVKLNAAEQAELFKQDPSTRGNGGFQSLLVQMQEKLDPATGELILSDDFLERIPRYAFDYKNGGWEDRLKAMFSRHLGPRLGRD